MHTHEWALHLNPLFCDLLGASLALSAKHVKRDRDKANRTSSII